MTGIARNEPCPCGSGKKYKRCCGVDAAPKITAPKPATGPMADGGNPMANMDPQMMAQLSSALQRLPKGQMQRLQAIMQKAMSGKDVTRESEEFERTLPVEMQQMFKTFAAANAAGAANTNSEMTEEQARELVKKAVAEGKISEDQAKAALEGEQPKQSDSGISKLWRGITGKSS